jgi:hypothetical protein
VYLIVSAILSCTMLFVLLYFLFWPLCCLFFFDLRLLITSLWYLLAIVLSVLRFTASDYLPLVSFGHCIVCPSIYGLWLPPFGIFWRLYCLSFDLRLLITSLWYLLAIVLYCLSFDIRIMITSLWYILAIVLSVLRYTDYDYLPLVSFGHCIVCPSIYGLWLPPFGIFKLFLYIFWKLRMFCFSF